MTDIRASSSPADADAPVADRLSQSIAALCVETEQHSAASPALRNDILTRLLKSIAVDCSCVIVPRTPWRPGRAAASRNTATKSKISMTATQPFYMLISGVPAPCLTLRDVGQATFLYSGSSAEIGHFNVR